MMSLSQYLDLYFHPSLIFLLMLQTYFDISNPSPSLEPTQEATWSRSAISSTPSCIEPHLIPTFTVIDFLLPLFIHSHIQEELQTISCFSFTSLLPTSLPFIDSSSGVSADTEMKTYSSFSMNLYFPSVTPHPLSSKRYLIL